MDCNPSNYSQRLNEVGKPLIVTNEDEKSKFLQDSLGRELPFFVGFRQRIIQVFTTLNQQKLFELFLPGQIVDVDYFATEDNQTGFVVALQIDDDTGAVVLIKNVKGSWIINSLVKVPAKVTLIKTVFSTHDMLNQADIGLNKVVKKWQNVVAVGAKEGQCYLIELPPGFNENDDSVDDQKPVRKLNLLKAFVDRNGIFTYVMEGCKERTFPASSVRVTALALMARSRNLLIGLSMGGIISASLTPSNALSEVSTIREDAVRFLAPIEPDDDPERHEFFIVAYDSSPRHSITMCIFEGFFKQAEGQQKYDTVMYNPKFMVFEYAEDGKTALKSCGTDLVLELIVTSLTCKLGRKVDICRFGMHVIPNGHKWISVKTMPNELKADPRKVPSIHESMSTTNASMLDVTIGYGSFLKRNLALITYSQFPNDKNPDGVVMSGILDMNAYYFRRLPQKYYVDRTILRQCPFLSWIRTSLKATGVMDIQVMLTQDGDMSLFTSAISTADELFYPSALTFERVYVLDKNSLRKMRIESLQDDVLGHLTDNMAKCMRSPEPMAKIIIAAGIVQLSCIDPPDETPALAQPPRTNFLTEEEKIVLTATLHHSRIPCLSKEIRQAGWSMEQKHRIAFWLWQEACKYREAINDKSIGMMQSHDKCVSGSGLLTLKRGVTLFDDIHKLLTVCMMDPRMPESISKYADVIDNISHHTHLLYSLVSQKVIPIGDDLADDMKNEYETRRLEASKLGKILPIEETLNIIQRKLARDLYWTSSPNITSLYPPPVLNLLETVLTSLLTVKVKRDLILSFLSDWTRVKHKEITSDDERAVIIFKITQNCLEVTMDKVKSRLKQERDALSDKPTTSSSSTSTLVKSLSSASVLTTNGRDQDAELLLSHNQHTDKERYQKMYQKAIRDPEYLNRHAKDKGFQDYLVFRGVISPLCVEFSDDNKDKELVVKAMTKFTFNDQTTRQTGHSPSTKSKDAKKENVVRALMSNPERPVATLQPIETRGIFNVFDKRLTAEKARKRSLTPSEDPKGTKGVQESTSPPAKKTDTLAESPPKSPTAQAEDDQLYAAVRTPARLLKSAARSRRDENRFESPDGRHMIPTNTKAPTSILKSGKKLLQSPSRNIRFQGLSPLEDSQESDMLVSHRRSLNIHKAYDELTAEEERVLHEEEKMEEDGIELEKSYEVADDHAEQPKESSVEFQVLEIVSPEASADGKDEAANSTYVVERLEVEKVSEPVEVIEKTFEVAEDDNQLGTSFTFNAPVAIAALPTTSETFVVEKTHTVDDNSEPTFVFDAPVPSIAPEVLSDEKAEEVVTEVQEDEPMEVSTEEQEEPAVESNVKAETQHEQLRTEERASETPEVTEERASESPAPTPEVTGRAFAPPDVIITQERASETPEVSEERASETPEVSEERASESPVDVVEAFADKDVLYSEHHDESGFIKSFEQQEDEADEPAPVVGPSSSMFTRDEKEVTEAPKTPEKQQAPVPITETPKSHSRKTRTRSASRTAFEELPGVTASALRRSTRIRKKSEDTEDATVAVPPKPTRAVSDQDGKKPRKGRAQLNVNIEEKYAEMKKKRLEESLAHRLLQEIPAKRKRAVSATVVEAAPTSSRRSARTPKKIAPLMEEEEEQKVTTPSRRARSSTAKTPSSRARSTSKQVLEDVAEEEEKKPKTATRSRSRTNSAQPEDLETPKKRGRPSTKIAATPAALSPILEDLLVKSTSKRARTTSVAINTPATRTRSRTASRGE